VQAATRPQERLTERKLVAMYLLDMRPQKPNAMRPPRSEPLASLRHVVGDFL
jgi:hypothetical protein